MKNKNTILERALGLLIAVISIMLAQLCFYSFANAREIITKIPNIYIQYCLAWVFPTAVLGLGIYYVFLAINSIVYNLFNFSIYSFIYSIIDEYLIHPNEK